jgi:uncharacterized membrane protein YcaP (DUF421 family)
MFDVDWSQLFGFEKSILELVIRGTVMYWFLFAMFRFVMRRDVGAIGIADVLLIVIIADASQNAMSDDYESISEGMVVVGTLIFWNVLTNWLNFKLPLFQKFAEPPPLLLIRDGKVLERNMRREMLTRDELLSKLRQHGVERVEQVKWAYMESDGEVSVGRRDSKETASAGKNGGLPAH